MMRLCLEVWGGDWPRVRASALEAERLGFDGFFCGESLTDLDLDCFSVLAALAPLTRRIALGPVIANILPGCRPRRCWPRPRSSCRGSPGGASRSRPRARRLERASPSSAGGAFAPPDIEVLEVRFDADANPRFAPPE